MKMLAIIAGIITWKVITYFENQKLENYDITNVDSMKITNDMCNGVSVGERRRRLINGYYDKK